jgi:hypothetical protein
MKKYKDEDGNYLAIDETTYGYKIGWFIIEWADFGSYICETGGKEDQIIKPLVRELAGDDYTLHNGTYLFDSKREAQNILSILNRALIDQDITPGWPAWAIQAKNEGWVPPEMWKPKKRKN